MEHVVENQAETVKVDPFAKFDTIYGEIARNVKELSKTRLLFKTSAVIELGEFEKNFYDEMKAIYKCNICSEFFKKYGGLVYLDSHGNPISALFSDVISGNPSIDASIKQLKEKVEKSSIIDFLRPRELDVKKNGGYRVGFKKSGGWSHFHIDVSKKYDCAYGDFSLIVDETIGLFNKYGQGDLMHFVELLSANLKPVKNIPQAQKEKIELVKLGLSQIIKNRTGKGGSIKAAILISLDAAMGDQKLSGQMNSLIRLNGSALGGAIRSLKKGDSVESVIKALAERLDVDKFRVQDTSTLSPEALVQAENKFKSSSYMKSLDRRRAKVSDLEQTWARPSVEQESEGGEFNPFAKVKARGQVERDSVIRVLTPQRVTVEHFINNVLPVADSIKMMLSGSMKPWTFNVPKDEMSPSIFTWDDNNGRAYCTSVPSVDSPKFSHNITHTSDKNGSYIEFEAVVPTPWTFGLEGSRMQGASPTWILVATANNEPRKINAVQSYGQALKGELFPYRKAIDAALSHAKVECDGEYALGYSFGIGQVLEGVRVLSGNTEQAYIIDGTTI